MLTLGDAVRFEVGTSWWLLLLFGIEFFRQVHLVVLERSESYRTFYLDRVVARADRLVDQFEYRQRYRASRALGWFAVGYVVLFVFARSADTTVVSAIVDLPLWLWSIVPFLARTAAISLLVLIPFATACWLIFRGGVTVYRPTAVTTRYRDVQGQDRVLAGVRDKTRHLSLQLARANATEPPGGCVSGGIVLCGPPGTGKSLTATAVAGETGSALVVVDLAVFRPVRFGPGLGRLKVASLFRRVRRLGARFGSVVVLFERIEALDGDRDGTLAALSAELSAELSPTTRRRPSGLANRFRQAFGAPRLPARYWTLLVAAAAELGDVPAELLRPGQLDRRFEVGVPDRHGRESLLAGFLAGGRHTLTAEQVRRLAIASPGATGAGIRQWVDGAFSIALQAGRDSVTWSDLLLARAGQSSPQGLPDQRNYGAAERHSLALHQACHTVVAYRLRSSRVDADAASVGVPTSYPAGPAGCGFGDSVVDVDLVTVECRDPGSRPPLAPGGEADDRVHSWNSEVEMQVMVSLAALVGERMFYHGDNSAAVADDLRTATALVCRHLSGTAFGQSLASREVMLSFGPAPGDDGAAGGPSFGDQVEARLRELYGRTEAVVSANRRWVLAVAHALETHQMLTGDDVDAVLRGTVGPTVDGRRYHDPGFLAVAEAYHVEALCAHRGLPSRGLRPPDLDRHHLAASS